MNNMPKCIALLLLVLFVHSGIVSASKAKFVTCGSVLKLLNVDYRVRLHSHDVKYGTGSGQQSVTGTELQEDANSHWAVIAELGKQCDRGILITRMAPQYGFLGGPPTGLVAHFMLIEPEVPDEESN